MTIQRSLAAALAVVVVCSVLAPLAAAAAETDDGDDGTVSVEAFHDDGLGVAVEEDGAPVENATVEVMSTDEARSYAGAGEYRTDPDGIVDLPEPDLEEGETMNVSIVAETAAGTAAIEPTLYVEPTDETDGNETDGNESTDDPAENWTDEFDGTVTDELRNLTDSLPFGSIVSTFVEAERGESTGPFGQQVSAFVAEFTPADPPAHAGPPSHAGPPGEAEPGPVDDERGPPVTIPGESGDQGPPAHAGPDPDDEADDDRNGPPAHAGGPVGN